MTQPAASPIQVTSRTRLPVITALVALGSISVSMYLPSLPSMARALHASPSAIKLSLTAFLFVFAGAQTLYGPLSDRFGRKAPVAAGMILYLIGSALCSVAANANALIAARVVQAVGAAAGPALGRAVARDLYSGTSLTSALAIIAAAVALSPMLGPVAGGYLQTAFGWRSTFYVLTAAGALLLLATLFLLPETNTHIQAGGLNLSTIRHNYHVLLSDSEYVSSLLCGGLLTAGNFAWTAIAPFLFALRFHFSPTQYGNVTLFVGGGYLLGTFLCGRLSGRIDAPVLVYTGLGLSIVSSSCIVILSGPAAGYIPIVASMVLFTLGMGIVIPMAAACALSLHPEIAGASAGLLGSLQIFTGALGALAAGFFHPGNLRPTAILLLIVSAAALLAGYIALQPFRSRTVSTSGAHA